MGPGKQLVGRVVAVSTPKKRRGNKGQIVEAYDTAPSILDLGNTFATVATFRCIAGLAGDDRPVEAEQIAADWRQWVRARPKRMGRVGCRIFFFFFHFFFFHYFFLFLNLLTFSSLLFIYLFSPPPRSR
jgi:hypothetical protein